MKKGIRGHDIKAQGLENICASAKEHNIKYLQLVLEKSIDGFKTDDFSEEYAEKVKAQLGNIQIAVLGSYINPSNPNDADLANDIAKFKEKIKYASVLNPMVVGTETGTYKDGMTNSEEAYERVLSSICEVLSYAQKYNVCIGIEGVHCFVINTPQKMKRLIDDLNSDNVKVIFDPVNYLNIIGEHIDYCGGCVMPAALTMKTTIIARKRNDNVIRLKATDLDILVETTISEMKNLKGKLKWGDYQIGVALELINAGYDVCGCDLLYDDTVPHGGGLSSSAAIEVSTALMFATFANEKSGNKKDIDMIEMALLSQKAEHNFIDVKCGIMDQFASAMGKKDHAIYLNCATLEYEHIPLKLDGYKIVLTNTNVKHSLGSSKYNERRKECEEGLLALKGAMPNIEQLADVTPKGFELHKDLITDSTVQKRIKHVVYECDRVKKSSGALKNNEITKFGELMNESHNSLQYEYEVTCPELDFVVQEGRKIKGVLGIRMTGAGFGGCTVAIIKDEDIDNYIENVGKAFLKEFGHDASFYVTQIGNGGREMSN